MRDLKTLLEVVLKHLEQVTYIVNGLCYETVIINHRKLITWQERQVLEKFIDSCTTDIGIMYLFPKGDKESREQWLNEKINELK